jgi:protein-S-isoprenylcysteine O-methyltransferase Ste14
MIGFAADHFMIVVCFAMWFFVFRENPFASSIIEIGVNQRVIDSGRYALVRHPTYSAALLLFVGTTLALGSFLGLLLILVLAAGLVARLLHEERYLISNLPGYDLYRSQVRWRLVPGVW